MRLRPFIDNQKRESSRRTFCNEEKVGIIASLFYFAISCGMLVFFIGTFSDSEITRTYEQMRQEAEYGF